MNAGNVIILIIITIAISCMIYEIYSDSRTDPGASRINYRIENTRFAMRKSQNEKNIIYAIRLIHHRIKILREYLMNNIDRYPEYRSHIKSLIEGTEKINIDENIDPVGTDSTSYTINKGETIVVCFRSSKNNKLHDINTIMYVVIHELSHIACPDDGHTQLFWDIFTFLLKISAKLGIYNLVDYKSNPQEYCGIVINENLVA